MKRFKPILWTVCGSTFFSLLAIVYLLTFHGESPKAQRFMRRVPAAEIFIPKLLRTEIAAALGRQRISSNHLKMDSFPLEVKGQSYEVKFTLDRDLQERIEDIYDRYSPAYAAFVAMDPDTGRILAMADYSAESNTDNLALRASYPTASVFKVVTSAAALDEKKIEPRTIMPVNGSYGTLYRRNLRDVVTRWTRYISIEEAFAKSVNTVFAKIAMKNVGPQALQKYANAFGFNQKIDFDMQLDSGSAIIPDDSFGLAESGSGYTRRQTMSPIQGAMIASAVINGGTLPSPYLVQEVRNKGGVKVFESKEMMLGHAIDQSTAHTLSMIMEHTITQGTARKEYRDYNHHPVLSKLFIGAKTGTLNGDSPSGKYDWFVGFAQSSSNPKKKIAFASMIVNRSYWKVKASHVAREAILQYFADRHEL